MKVVITGGAGFIGVNAAEYFLKKGEAVVLFDNLSRAGAEENKKWICGRFPGVEFIQGDIRNTADCERLFQKHSDAAFVLHLAAQVAVTTSVANPRADFENNAAGSLNVLEGVRKHCPESFCLYASTNKVYGKMEELKVVEKENRYQYADCPRGISEKAPLDFYSPYGCSKGTADQYFRDYHRIYGLQTAVFRQSCIYGYRQFGVEDQGWVAWFIIAVLTGQPLTIYGDGKQVRDVLFITDLVRAFDLVYQRREKTSGKIYNIGGGPANTLSLLELLGMLETLLGRKIAVKYSGWRPGDQKVYISDITKSRKDFGWKPEVSSKEGVEKLYQWVKP